MILVYEVQKFDTLRISKVSISEAYLEIKAVMGTIVGVLQGGVTLFLRCVHSEGVPWYVFIVFSFESAYLHHFIVIVGYVSLQLSVT